MDPGITHQFQIPHMRMTSVVLEEVVDESDTVVGEILLCVIKSKTITAHASSIYFVLRDKQVPPGIPALLV